MPWVGIEPIVPAFERAETIHALDSAAPVTGAMTFSKVDIYLLKSSIFLASRQNGSSMFPLVLNEVATEIHEKWQKMYSRLE
jgi:hypothetical protein